MVDDQLNDHLAAAVTSDVMQREFRTADPSEMADGVLARLQECKCSSLPVRHQGRLVGIVTAETLGEFLMIQAALRGGGPAQTVTA